MHSISALIYLCILRYIQLMLGSHFQMMKFRPKDLYYFWLKKSRCYEVLNLYSATIIKNLVKAMVFPMVMYGSESWTIKKAEHRRVDAFILWYWRRLLRVPWIARRSNQSILKEFNPKYSLEGLMLKLKLQYFGHLMERTDSFEKTLMLGKIEDRRRRGWQRIRWLGGIINCIDMSLSKLQDWWWTGKPDVLQSMGSQRVTHNWANELNWTDHLYCQCQATHWVFILVIAYFSTIFSIWFFCIVYFFAEMFFMFPENS